MSAAHTLQLPQHSCPCLTARPRRQARRGARAAAAQQQQQQRAPLLLTTADVPAYIAAAPPLAQLLGGGPDDWVVQELAGGVINAAWAVRSKRAPAGASSSSGGGGSGSAAEAGGGILLKQAPPYVRAVGPSFPLSTVRMEVEAAAMRLLHPLAPAAAPRLLWHDAANSVLAAPLLAPPGHVPMLEALQQGRALRHVPRQVGQLLAAMFAATSEAALGPEAHAAAVARFANADIVAANEQVVLVGPFTPGEHTNEWLPELEADVRAMWADEAAMAGAARALALYRGSRQCLIHNDLHFGNVLASEGGAVVIDWEFATYGPPAYDLGSLLASCFLAYIAAELGGGQEGGSGGGVEASSRQAAAEGGGGGERGGWLLLGAAEGWEAAAGGWWAVQQEQHAEQRGLQCSGGPAQQRQQQQGRPQAGAGRGEWEARLLGESLAFAGVCMCRYVVGRHPYPLFAGLRAPGARARCERAALIAGRRLLGGGGGGGGGGEGEALGSVEAAAAVVFEAVRREQRAAQGATV